MPNKRLGFDVVDLLLCDRVPLKLLLPRWGSWRRRQIHDASPCRQRDSLMRSLSQLLMSVSSHPTLLVLRFTGFGNWPSAILAYMVDLANPVVDMTAGSRRIWKDIMGSCSDYSLPSLVIEIGNQTLCQILFFSFNTPSS